MLFISIQSINLKVRLLSSIWISLSILSLSHIISLYITSSQKLFTNIVIRQHFLRLKSFIFWLFLMNLWVRLSNTNFSMIIFWNPYCFNRRNHIIKIRNQWMILHCTMILGTYSGTKHVQLILYFFVLSYALSII